MSIDSSRTSKRLKLSLKKQNVSHNGSLTRSFEEDVYENVDPVLETATTDAAATARPLPVATLLNLGNTCYLGSVLHALRWIGGKFNLRLHAVELARDTCIGVTQDAHGTSEEEIVGDQVTVCLHIHKEMRRVENDNGTEEKRAVDPSQLLATLRKLDRSYEGNDQHDAHELLTTVLRAIETTGRLSRKSAPTRVGKRCRNLTTVKGEETEVSLFQGKTVFRTTCLECESTLEMEDVFWDVPLPLALATHERRDDHCLRGDNKFWCDGCFHHNEAHRSTHFVLLPSFLVVRSEPSVMTSLTRATSDLHKANGTVDVPLELPCLLESCSKPCSSRLHAYHLASVICHTGATSSSGHYTTYVRRETTIKAPVVTSCRYNTRRTKTNGNKMDDCCGVSSLSELDPNLTWLYFDDEKVSSFDSLPTFDTEYSTVVPYLLLYRSSSENTN